MRNVVIKNLDEMRAFAKKVAGRLRGGEVLGLVGDLGAGKTTFVQMLAAEMGVAGAVKSPTFILLQQLATNRRASGPKTLCHVDAYRLKDWSELAAIGFEEYASDPTVTCLVEWADRVPEIHRFNGFSEISFVSAQDDTRTLTLQGELFSEGFE